MSRRIPRRHRFRTRDEANTLFRRLPAERRFRLAAGAHAPQWMGTSPLRVIRGDADSGLPKAALRRALPRVPDAHLPGFPGGALGFVAYERGHALEGLPARAGAGRPEDEVWFGIYDTFAVVHPAEGDVEIVSWGWTGEDGFDARLALRRAEALEECLRGAGDPTRAASLAGIAADAPQAPSASLDEAGHALAVARILEAIRAGEIYQANLTVRFRLPAPPDPVEFFERLLRENPAPHGTYLEADGGPVICCSPERLLSARGRDLVTRPIKGTAPRAADPAEDAALAAALRESPKDRAELLMITDLMRNDLGKVCEPGTVRVPRLLDVESFPHLHHLVSTITGRLRPGLDVLDALEAVFPCGSITGAPKHRAMRILASLEPEPRGVYTGTVGWLGFDRSADLAVAIRTGRFEGGVFSFGSGGGIVADSDAAAEWRELLLKARAFAQALEFDPEAAAPGRSA